MLVLERKLTIKDVRIAARGLKGKLGADRERERDLSDWCLGI